MSNRLLQLKDAQGRVTSITKHGYVCGFCGYTSMDKERFNFYYNKKRVTVNIDNKCKVICIKCKGG